MLTITQSSYESTMQLWEGVRIKADFQVVRVVTFDRNIMMRLERLRKGQRYLKEVKVWLSYSFLN